VKAYLEILEDIASEMGHRVQSVKAEHSGAIALSITEWERKRQDRLDEICGPE